MKRVINQNEVDFKFYGILAIKYMQFIINLNVDHTFLHRVSYSVILQIHIHALNEHLVLHMMYRL